jgi:hypothetical protein
MRQLILVGAALVLGLGFLRAGDTFPTLAPRKLEARHVMVYHKPGRFGGWPANHGIWSWGDEILVGFSAGWYKDLGPERHAIDRDKPEEHLLARSRDGGRTWTIEDPGEHGALIPVGKALHGVAPPAERKNRGATAPADSTSRTPTLS